jgi:hypothetical protein
MRRSAPNEGNPRPAGPTFQPLGLNFGVEVKYNRYNSVQLTHSQIPTLEHYK